MKHNIYICRIPHCQLYVIFHSSICNESLLVWAQCSVATSKQPLSTAKYGIVTQEKSPTSHTYDLTTRQQGMSLEQRTPPPSYLLFLIVREGWERDLGPLITTNISLDDCGECGHGECLLTLFSPQDEREDDEFICGSATCWDRAGVAGLVY